MSTFICKLSMRIVKTSYIARTWMYIALCCAMPAQAVDVQPPKQIIEVRSAAVTPTVTAPEANFTGRAHITTPFQATLPGRTGGAVVTFEPGARTAWHMHPLGQILVVTEGLGVVQQEGQPAQVIRPGDVVNIPANVHHWHGAGVGVMMTHIAIAEKLNGDAVFWYNKVTDQEYQTALTDTALVSKTLPAILSNEGHTKRQLTVISTGNTSVKLSARQQMIPLIASFMANSEMSKLNDALNVGLDAGMSIAEAKEVLVQLCAYVGFPKSLNALGELLNVVETRKQHGIRDLQGGEPSRVTTCGQELIAIGKANQTLISGGLVQSPVFDFAPVINQYLQSHLFGDIFERDNLDWQSRELATLGALAATPGVESQLRSHIRASMRVGLSAAQLQQMVQILSTRGNPEAATRANQALAQIVDTTQRGEP